MWPDMAYIYITMDLHYWKVSRNYWSDRSLFTRFFDFYCSHESNVCKKKLKKIKVQNTLSVFQLSYRNTSGSLRENEKYYGKTSL